METILRAKNEEPNAPNTPNRPILHSIHGMHSTHTLTPKPGPLLYLFIEQQFLRRLRNRLYLNISNKIVLCFAKIVSNHSLQHVIKLITGFSIHSFTPSTALPSYKSEKYFTKSGSHLSLDSQSANDVWVAHVSSCL